MKTSKSSTKQCPPVGKLLSRALEKITSNFAILDFEKDNKTLLQPIEKYYIIGALPTNCHTCLYGSQTDMLFAHSPPLKII